MSLPFFSRLHKFTSTTVVGQGSGSHVIPRLISATHSVRNLRHSEFSGKEIGPSNKSPLLCRYHLSCVRSGIIAPRQTTSPAAAKNVPVDLNSNGNLYSINSRAGEASMLNRWNTWASWPNYRRKLNNQNFSLWCVFHIFDSTLFHGLVPKNVKLRWVDPPIGKPGWLSRTVLKSDAKRGYCLSIEIMKPQTKGTWTNAIMQERLEALLLEMTEVLFFMQSCSCIPFQQSVGRVASFGNRSSRRKMLRATEKKANLLLKGLPKPWKMGR